MSAIFKYLLTYEESWCKLMSYFNPYIDPFKFHLTSNMPVFDGRAYERYPDYKYVYDKLWVVKSQGLLGGKLEDLKGRENKITYPIFIKPRWGHLSASSKNCFKIKSADELSKYMEYEDMMWSEFIDANEGMTDFILLNGRIVHQITYIYSEKQNGFTDDWKYISPKSKPPTNITEWINNHMKKFTGVVNVQYRDAKIIEVGLRLARGGAYLVSTENGDLIKNINNIFDKQFWDFSLQNKLDFKPFYVFKCFTTLPIIYIFPQHILDYLIRSHTSRPFYEYYFEPAGKDGMVFLQFMDDDFNRGMKTKEKIQTLFTFTQVIMYILLLTAFILLVPFFQLKWKNVLIILIVLILLTRYLNPIGANYNLYKAQKQFIFGGGPNIKKEDIDE